MTDTQNVPFQEWLEKLIKLLGAEPGSIARILYNSGDTPEQAAEILRPGVKNG